VRGRHVSLEEGCAREVLFVSIFQRYFKTNAKIYNATTSRLIITMIIITSIIYSCVCARAAAFYGGVNAAAGWLKFNF